MKNLPIIASLFILLAPVAFADSVDWQGAQEGTFEVNFKACTADLHVAHVGLLLTTYSPFVSVPEGYTQADKNEVALAAQTAFANQFGPFISRANDATAAADRFLGDVSNESVEVEDENGKKLNVSVVILAMADTKAELMKTKKYSGMGVNYERSILTVDANTSCNTAK